MVGVLREVLPDRTERLAILRDHPGVVGPGRPLRARRPKVLVEALATPRGLDQQDRLIEVVADDVAELELGPEVVLAAIHRVADGQLADFEVLATRPIPDDDVRSLDPHTVRVLEVGVLLLVRRGLHQPFERAAAAVVVLLVVEIDDGLPLHVGLTSQQEHPQHRWLGGRLTSQTHHRHNGHKRREEQPIANRTQHGDREYRSFAGATHRTSPGTCVWPHSSRRTGAPQSVPRTAHSATPCGAILIRSPYPQDPMLAASSTDGREAKHQPTRGKPCGIRAP